MLTRVDNLPGINYIADGKWGYITSSPRDVGNGFYLCGTVELPRVTCRGVRGVTCRGVRGVQIGTTL